MAPYVRITDIGEERPCTDFTPDVHRQNARSVEAISGPVHVWLSESERDDPTLVFLSLQIGGEKECERLIADGAEVSVKYLDTLIEALTIARDTALVEGMIEPSLAA
jgi:hypothetical protein